MNIPRLEYLSVKVVAWVMRLSEDTIQAGLIQGRFPWGYAVQTGEHRYRYWINAQKFIEMERIPEEIVRAIALGGAEEA